MSQKQIRHEFLPAAGKSYTKIPFAVAADTEYIVVRGRYTVEQQGSRGSVDIGLADADQQIRGWSSNLNNLEQIFLGQEQASYGYLAGPLPPGTWHILLGDNRPHNAKIVVELQLELMPCRPRIICGDLHSHSLYSDGAHSIEKKLSLAAENGLDFLACTDHNSVAQNFCLPTDPNVLLLPSCEITTYNGHVNILGYEERCIPNFMCQSSAEVRRVLTELKKQDVYLQLNHPIRHGDRAGCQWNWDYDMPFDWMEIWNGPWNQNNVANLALWQEFLVQGRFLPAAANSDFHSQESKRQGYPCNNVWVHQKTRREIFAALAKGHNYVTAEPLPQRNFAARCLLSASREWLPFGTTVPPRQELAGGPAGSSLRLELSVAQMYLDEVVPLSLRAWTELGQLWEMELQAAHFSDCTPVAGRNRQFCLDNLPGENYTPRFLRFELFECESKKALLLSNPIFWH